MTTTDTPVQPSSLPTSSHLPNPDDERLDRALRAVETIYHRASDPAREQYAGTVVGALAGRVRHLRTLHEQRVLGGGELVVGPQRGRVTDAQVEHALDSARISERHPSGSNLRVLAAKVRELLHDVEQLHELGEQDYHQLSMLLMREQAVRDIWNGLTPASAADVPHVLAAELVELAESYDGTSRTERELARLRRVDAAVGDLRGYLSKIANRAGRRDLAVSPLHTPAEIEHVGEAVLAELEAQRDELARLRAVDEAARALLTVDPDDNLGPELAALSAAVHGTA